MKYILYIVVSLIWFPIAVVSLPLVLVAAAIRATTKRLVSWGEALCFEEFKW